jgi:hypothetical protein
VPKTLYVDASGVKQSLKLGLFRFLWLSEKHIAETTFAKLVEKIKVILNLTYFNDVSFN